MIFDGAAFSRNARFEGAEFAGLTHFIEAKFMGKAVFSNTTFVGDTYVIDTLFKGSVNFYFSRFTGRTLFASRQEARSGEVHPPRLIFEGTHEVDFQEVFIEPLNALRFRHVDLRHCRFLDTDLRKVEMTAVVWPQIGRWFGGRPCVYDEKLPQSEPSKAHWWQLIPRERCNELCTKEATGSCKVCEALEEADRFLWGWLEVCMRGYYWTERFCREHVLQLPPKGSLLWSQIERLYRELKQNHEDRRDYARAGDFHYGEKEMQRRNPQTPRSLRLFLWLYWLASGYGVFWLRPLMWALVLWLVSTGSYLWSSGLLPKSAGAQACSTTPLTMTNISDWLRGALYCLRVMTFLRPDELIPNGWDAIAVHTLDSLLGPLFLGLFALAISQRLKR